MTIALVILALLLANAFFVAAEFAIIGVSRTAVEHRANLGDGLARRILGLLTTPARQDRFIATAQLGITLASLGLGMYGEHTFAAWLEPRLELAPTQRFIAAHSLASILAIGCLTYLHIFVGEMLPKAIALAHAEGAARVLYWPMLAGLVVFYPFVRMLNAAGNFCLRLFGIHRSEGGGDHGYTVEELQIIVEESAEGGAMRAEAGSILSELLEFGDLTAGQVMVPRVRVAGIPLSATADRLREIMAKYHHTRYPIYDGDLDHIVGMLHVKDLLRPILSGAPLTTATMRQIPVVPETATLDAVLRVMKKASAHMAVVIDEHGGTAGVISLEDLFEEVVGEIDEGQPAAPPLVATGNGSALVAGTLRIDELGRHFDLDLAHEEVDSVSGLILALLGRPPVPGDVVRYGRIRLEVTTTSGRGVRQARAILLPPSED
ncbi:MAG TPA: hemolysin family protein [Vicinamibacterales bacterium]|nr:hemolysin family protein [Vicinamibacterales bacterium]